MKFYHHIGEIFTPVMKTKGRNACVCVVRCIRIVMGPHFPHFQVTWPGVRQLWATLWQLPLQIPLQASRLLHAHFSHTLTDATLPLMTLLAAEAKMISLRPTDRQLAPAHVPDTMLETITLEPQHQLRELDITGVDLGLNTTLLELLLPRCPNLYALKLGGNTSPCVLRAAKACPIRVLHMSERLVWSPRVLESDLMVTFFGVTDVRADQMLQNMKDRKSYNMILSWPLLKDLCTGFCRTKCEFLLLVMLIFKDLDRISCKSINCQRLLDTYINYMHNIADIPKLKLKSCTLISGDLARVTVAVPDLEEVTLVPRGGSDQTMAEDLKVLTGLPLFKVLRLHNLRHFGHGDLPMIFDNLKLIGPQLVELELQGGKTGEVCVGFLPSVLQNCPNLRGLSLDTDLGFTDTHTGPLKVGFLIYLTAFKCRAPHFSHTTLISLFQWFPNLQNLMLAGRVNDIEVVINNLSLLPELRVLKLTAKQHLPVQAICELPRSTRHSTWELHVPLTCLTEADISKITFSGWTYVPISEYNSW